ncbi:MAG TPA: GntR family transcriptional regulator [Fimbriimonas sp.]
MNPREEAWGYQAISDDLRDRIRSGVHPAGTFLPTERELQAFYRVSRSTIRRALSVLAESGWAEAKPNRGVAARLGPIPDRSNNVAFIDHAESVNQHFFFALSRELQAHGMHLTHIDSSSRTVEGAVEYAALNGFGAAYVWSKEGFPDAARLQAAQAKMPVIAVDHGLRGFNCDLISLDNMGGSCMAVEHVARQGRKRIAVTGMTDMLEINHEKFSGYLRGLFRSGLQPSPKDFVFCSTSGMHSPDTSSLERRLADEDRPDAVFVMQDMFAPVVVEAIFACGLRVPEDVAVVAFSDDVPLQIDNVGLTTVAVDWRSFAQTSAERLLRRLERPHDAFTQSTLPVSLVVRGSCGAPRHEWTPDPTAFDGPGAALRRLHHEYLQIRSDAGNPPGPILSSTSK